MGNPVASPGRYKTGQALVELVLPATSANLGPCFDSASVALGISLHVRAQAAVSFSYQVSGRDAQSCQGADDLIRISYEYVLRKAGRTVSPLAITVRNEIPVGKGCGSSAAARTAGVLLANYFGQLGLCREELLRRAVELEGHADNCAACLYGGMVVVGGDVESELRVLQISSVPDWEILIVCPPEVLPTTNSRNALPQIYSRKDVVTNVQNAMFLVLALQQGRADLLSQAMQDRLHEPYRSSMCPLLDILRPMSGHEGILGVALSGAGPSVLMFIESGIDQRQVTEQVQCRLQRHHLEAELLFTKIAARGAVLVQAAL